MADKQRRRGPPIHPSIKIRLGYDASQPDNEIYKDWKERTSRICKPCWEIKYCPYGPLVEQSPTLPSLREGTEEQIEYFKKCLSSNLVGSAEPLSDERRSYYEEWVADGQTLLKQAHYQLQTQKQFHAIEGESTSDDERIANWLGRPLPPIHQYRTPYSISDDNDLEEEDFEPDVWTAIKNLAEKQKAKFAHALETGVDDYRSPLEPARRAWFQKCVDEYTPDDHPDLIPDTFLEGECSVFGHICPVFFAAEALTETEEERRIGRVHLSFETMMRIVRRDNYRCQECDKQLQDNEVEFDHVIPVSKGGSSEEHNLRLTCFDCNRGKRDDYEP